MKLKHCESICIYEISNPILLKDLDLFKENEYLFENIIEENGVMKSFTVHIMEGVNSTSHFEIGKITAEGIKIEQHIATKVLTSTFEIIKNKYIVGKSISSSLFRMIREENFFHTNFIQPENNKKKFFNNLFDLHTYEDIYLKYFYNGEYFDIKSIKEARKKIDIIVKSKIDTFGFHVEPDENSFEFTDVYFLSVTWRNTKNDLLVLNREIDLGNILEFYGIE